MNRLRTLVSLTALLLFAVGCEPKPAPQGAPAPGKAAKPAEEAHAHGAGPHGGVVIDWGGGAYHVELTIDHDKQEATVYILGDDEKTPATIKAQNMQLFINEPKTEIDLAAKPLEGEAEGTSSRFVGTHETLGIARTFSGGISGVVEGTPYSNEFKQEPAK